MVETARTDAPMSASAPPLAGAAAPVAEVEAEESATRMFSRSIVISGVRCLLAYIIFPWVLPAVGVASGWGPAIGLVVGVVAIAFNVASIRRFYAADHKWKKPIAALNCTVIAMLLVLIAIDLNELF